MFKKKIIAIVLVAMQSSIQLAMTRKVVSKLPKVSESYLPNTFITTQGMPKTSMPKTTKKKKISIPKVAQDKKESMPKVIKKQFDSLLQVQKPELQQKTIMKQEILDYMISHPEDAAEIIDFYMETRKVHGLIEKRLKLLPEQAQRFFKSQVQKYRGSNFFKGMNLTELENIKRNVLELKDALVPAVLIMVGVVIIICILIDSEKRNRDKIEANTLSYTYEVQDEALLEVFNLILDALDLDPIPLMHFRPKDIKRGNAIAHYSFYTIAGVVALDQTFFRESIPVQVKILLHELRHHLQMAKNINEYVVIPADVVKYAKECGVQPYGFYGFIRTGFFWTSAMIEFDADNFAQQQMKDTGFMQDIKKVWPGKFNPDTGYFQGDMWLKDVPIVRDIEDKNLTLGDIALAWNKFWNKVPLGENLYLKYVPEHLKQAAAKNRAAKAKVKPKTSSEKLFDRYLANLDQEFAGFVK